jgi:phosphoglucomutase
VREKDGLWAVLTWLSILAHYNKATNKPLVHVRDIVLAHWRKYGRNYYSRYDYEGVPSTAAAQVMDSMRAKMPSMTAGMKFGSFELARAEEFTYTDPIDGSIARQQGLMFIFTDGSRIIFRLSGTAGSGATIRMYMEKYTAVTTELEQETANALQEIITIALEISDMVKLTGMANPTVIT